MITPAFTQETAHPIGQYRRHFGNNCERDFLRCFAADVESRRREEVSNTGFEIEQSILAEPSEQLGSAFSGPEQSDVSKLDRKKAIQREKIAAEMMIHNERRGLCVWLKIFTQLGRMHEMLDWPAEIFGELTQRFDFRPAPKE